MTPTAKKKKNPLEDCLTYIKSKEEQNVFQLMFWLVQPADLNPIELAWEALSRKVRARQSSCATKLWQKR